MSSKQSSVKWYLRYASYPPIESLLWRDVRGNEIPWITDTDMNPQRKLEARIEEDRKIILSIRNININDSGFYRLYANNGKMEKELKMELRVKGTYNLLTFVLCRTQITSSSK